VNRRKFIRDAGIVGAVTAALPLIARSEVAPLAATLTIDLNKKLAAMPVDFTGLSYEAAQLANPSFFSAENKALIEMFRRLGPQGVLRIGGGTSEFTVFTTEEPAGPPPFDAVGPDRQRA
jgi:hypothetical protein